MEKIAFFPPPGDYLSSSVFITQCKNLIMKDGGMCHIWYKEDFLRFKVDYVSEFVLFPNSFFLKHLNISVVGFIYLYVCNNNLLFLKHKDSCYLIQHTIKNAGW